MIHILSELAEATDLFKFKTSIDKIKELGRWKSNAVYKYLRTVKLSFPYPCRSHWSH